MQTAIQRLTSTVEGPAKAGDSDDDRDSGAPKVQVHNCTPRRRRLGRLTGSATRRR